MSFRRSVVAALAGLFLLGARPSIASADAISWAAAVGATSPQFVMASNSGLAKPQSVNIGALQASMSYEFLVSGGAYGYQGLLTSNSQAIRFANTSRPGLTQFGAYDHEFAGSPLPLNTEMLLTFVSSGGSTKMYLNGVYQAVLNDTLSLSGAVNLGGMASKGDLFNGTIYGAAVWGRALTAEEVAANYAAEASQVPEPATLLLVGTGLAGAVSRYRRRRADAA